MRNNVFSGLSVETDDGDLGTNVSHIFGGGIVGGYSEGAGDSGSLDISGNTFQTLTTTADGDISGGGVLGVSADSTAGVAGIDNMRDNLFRGAGGTQAAPTDVSANAIHGGGIVGGSGETGDTILNNLFNNTFENLKVEVDTGSGSGAIAGGGILGSIAVAATPEPPPSQRSMASFSRIPG
jgi:hypothetical protein